MENSLFTSVPVTVPLIRYLAVGSVIVMGLLFFLPVFYTVNEFAAIGVPLLFLICGIALNKKLKIDKWTAEIYVLLSFWLIYAMFSMLWVKNTTVAFYYTRGILFSLLVFFTASQLFRSKKYRSYAPLLMQFIFLGYCLIYIWELATGMHLPSSRLYGIPLPIPTGAFYNENNSAVFMLLLAPFLTVKTGLTKHRIGRTTALLMFLFMVVVAVIQGSRMAQAVMLLLGIYYFFRAGLYLKIMSAAIIILSLAVFIIGFPAEANLTRVILHRQLISLANESTSYFMTSSKIRTQLNKESIDMAAQSGFLGVGSGNYEYYLHKGRYHRTAWIANPHNWWMELLANFGLLIALGMVFMYLRWLFRLWQLRQSSFGKDFDLYDAYFVSLLLFILLTIIPSSLRGYYSVWFYLGLIHTVCLTYRRQPDIMMS
jgi:teichuronic acid biosynthesis protein TuaE